MKSKIMVRDNISSGVEKKTGEVAELRSNKKRKHVHYRKGNKSNPNPSTSDSLTDPKSGNITTAKSSTFLEKMRSKLLGGHFRMINEKLYTCTGKEALKYFKQDPELFNVYHAGYLKQMSHWPEQPVNKIIKWLHNHNPSFVVADFGCGDGHLSKNVKNKVFSLDLISKDSSVIACDMSKTPLENSCVDVAVFCLSLMGTDFPRYLEEAHRVLKSCGWLLIAEVKSRFDPNNGGVDPTLFSKCISSLGFSPYSKDFSNKMFILLYFKKEGQKGKENKNGDIRWPELKPCLYKRR